MVPSHWRSKITAYGLCSGSDRDGHPRPCVQEGSGAPVPLRNLEEVARGHRREKRVLTRLPVRAEETEANVVSTDRHLKILVEPPSLGDNPPGDVRDDVPESVDRENL